MQMDLGTLVSIISLMFDAIMLVVLFIAIILILRAIDATRDVKTLNHQLLQAIAPLRAQLELDAENIKESIKADVEDELREEIRKEFEKKGKS